eukprot:gene2298-2986_t
MVPCRWCGTGCSEALISSRYQPKKASAGTLTAVLALSWWRARYWPTSAKPTEYPQWRGIDSAGFALVGQYLA